MTAPAIAAVSPDPADLAGHSAPARAESRCGRASGARCAAIAVALAALLSPGAPPAARGEEAKEPAPVTEPAATPNPPKQEPAAQPERTKQEPAARPDQGNCKRADFRLILDVGHTAKDGGAKSARGADEFDFNLRLAKKIDRSLIDAGFSRTVLLVTSGPARRGLAKRVTAANRASPDLFLSIHHDSVPDKFLETWEFEGSQHHFSDRFKGHSIFISNDNPERTASLQFGHLLGMQLKARGLQYTPHYTEAFMGHRQRILVDAEAGVYRYDQLIVLKNTRMPAVLLEAGSIINRDEELEMATPERQALIGAAVTDAVEQFCAARTPLRPHQVRPAVSQAAKQPHQARPAVSQAAKQPHQARPAVGQAVKQPARALRPTAAAPTPRR